MVVSVIVMASAVAVPESNANLAHTSTIPPSSGTANIVGRSTTAAVEIERKIVALKC